MVSWWIGLLNGQLIDRSIPVRTTIAVFRCIVTPCGSWIMAIALISPRTVRLFIDGTTPSNLLTSRKLVAATPPRFIAMRGRDSTTIGSSHPSYISWSADVARIEISWSLIYLGALNIVRSIVTIGLRITRVGTTTMMIGATPTGLDWVR